MKSKEVWFKKRPEGLPTDDDFAVAETEIGENTCFHQVRDCAGSARTTT